MKHYLYLEVCKLCTNNKFSNTHNELNNLNAI